MTLFLSKNLETSDKELLVLAVLNGLYTNKHETLFTSVDEIGYFATGRFLETKKDKTIIQGIKQGIKSLADRKIIEIIDNHKDNYIFTSKGLTVDTEKEKFLTIEQWEVQKIFNNSVKPFNLLNFFAQIISTVNTVTKEYHMSQECMIMFFGGSKSTLNEYIRQLEKLKLLYMYRPHRRRNDGTYRNINNVYGRYADREAIIESAKDYIDTIDSIEYAANLSSQRRSTKLRYNNFIAGAKKYQDNPKEIKRLYTDCVKYNKSLKTNPVEGGYGEDKEWKQGEELDLSVFPEYAKKDDIWGEPDKMDNFFKEDDDLIDDMY